MEAMPVTGERHSFKLSEFEGPLDLLLYMIRKNEVNIYDIPIAQITEQYIEYLCSAEFMDMEDLTSFHAMAANLLYIKSRMLLPVEMDEDAETEDPRAELVERLIEYQKYKKLSQLMEGKEKENEWELERRRLQHVLPFADDDGIWEKADVWDLLKTFSSLTLNFPGERIIDLYEEVTVNEKTTLLAELLENKGQCRFTELIVRAGALDIVCAFLAVLEAAKMRMIILLQNRLFGDILIRPNAAKVKESIL
ncbi:MAG: segregation/condensation protein A [Treponema sp.]|jgi:segregation and condensation protein A|nr:segregation/condensation protein A [Treponema sp.]